MLVYDKLAERELPDLFTFADKTPVKTVADWERRRGEITELLLREEYGRALEAPIAWSVEETKPAINACAGFAKEHAALMHLTLKGGDTFSFPFHYTMPNGEGKHRAFLLINFRSNVPDRYMPVEEIVDAGFAVFSFNYGDVTTDDGDFSTGLAGLYYKGRERTGDDPGKLMFWSYAAQRICDFMVTLPEIDTEHLAVTGHSRLGKTAFITGALDPRFRYVAGNDAGCSGDAPMRGKVPGNERVKHIVERFPFWFCPNYFKYAQAPESAAFDQHFLLALCAPRHLLVGSAETDNWADQPGQYLSTVAASRVWELYGIDPRLPLDEMPEVGAEYKDGGVGFHLRPGGHFFSRADWGAYMRYIDLHM